MRRQWLVGVVVVGALVLGAGLIVWVSTQGLLGPGGKARHLLGQADQAIARGQWTDAQSQLEQLIGTFPDSPWTDDGLLKLGQVYEQEQQVAEAVKVYRLLLEKFPSSPLAGEAQTRLGAADVALLFSPTIADGDVSYAVKPNDSLGKIAAANHTTVELLKRANGLSGDVIRPGKKLKVPTGQFRILVDKSQNQLLLTRGDRFFKAYHVSTGKDNSTPVGTFKVVNKVPNPNWYTQGAVVPPDSPNNILGTRWMGFDKPGYGIHGTTDPADIGQQVTAGCVRMRNPEVEELFAIVPLGTEVVIVD